MDTISSFALSVLTLLVLSVEGFFNGYWKLSLTDGTFDDVVFGIDNIGHFRQTPFLLGRASRFVVRHFLKVRYNS